VQVLSQEAERLLQMEIRAVAVPAIRQAVMELEMWAVIAETLLFTRLVRAVLVVMIRFGAATVAATA
jgi:hypothetical protein